MSSNKSTATIELVETIREINGSVINIYQPVDKITEEQMGSFVDFICDIKYRSLQIIQKKNNERVE